jgi:hypothetical protein
MQHPYFAGIDFDTLLSQKVPLTLPSEILNEYQFDDWQQAEVQQLK